MVLIKRISEGSLFDRICWSFMLTICVLASGHCVYNFWEKWRNSPISINLDNTPTPVWKIPFPAITICSENKARRTIFNFTEMYHKYENGINASGDEYEKYQAVSLVCDDHLCRRGNNTTTSSPADFIAKVAPELDEMLWQCKWKSHQSDCKTFFKPVMTDEGLCFTFNMLDAEKMLRKENVYNSDKHYNGWTAERGYDKNTPVDTYPMRGTGYGAKEGFTILMRAYDYDLDYMCRGPVQGFKVLLHSPAEIPRLSQKYYRIPLDQELLLAIEPKMITTSKSLKKQSPKKRQCYFPSERSLKYYKEYNQRHCELECLTNYTLQMCDCVAFYMPHDSTTPAPFCSSGSRQCVVKAQDDFLINDMRSGLSVMSGPSQNLSQKQAASQCNCLPACSAISYDAETSQAGYDWRSVYEVFKVNQNETPGIMISRLVVYFKESDFMATHRTELYEKTQLLDDYAGLLALSISFIFLCLLEVIYCIYERSNGGKHRRWNMQSHLNDFQAVNAKEIQH